MVQLRVTLLGPFNGLMAWLAKAEEELGGLRVVRTSWMARSPEEVKLTVGIYYNTIGAGEPTEAAQ